MGCDIHCHIEVKIRGRWEHYSAPNVERNYDLFARMAGVRERTDSGIVPIAQPRGFVEDPSTITRIDYEHGKEDWHSVSWLTGAEVEALIDEQRPTEPGAGATEIERTRSYYHPWATWRRGGLGYLFGSIFDAKRYPEDYPDGVEDCRLVFWFDN